MCEHFSCAFSSLEVLPDDKKLISIFFVADVFYYSKESDKIFKIWLGTAKATLRDKAKWLTIRLNKCSCLFLVFLPYLFLLLFLTANDRYLKLFKAKAKWYMCSVLHVFVSFGYITSLTITLWHMLNNNTASQFLYKNIS